MKVIILSIGDELLSGKTVNMNANYISLVLSDIGCEIVKQVTLADKENDILDCLDDLFKIPVDLILCTGGLGPTSDDITLDVIFSFFKSKKVFDDKYWMKLMNKYSNVGIPISKSNKKQALVPDNGTTIPNPVGTARGFQFKKNKIIFIAIPGVPSEMKAMMQESVLPMVKSKTVKNKHMVIIRTTGVAESILYDLINKNIDYRDINIGFYPSIYGVDIRLIAKNLKKLNIIKEDMANVIGEYCYTLTENNLEDVVVKNLIKHQFTIATAESCTGGLVGSRITEVPGSSKVYKGTIVAYSNSVKIDNLGIDKKTLEKYGAVSKEIAGQMANRVRKLFNSKIGVSTTGIAGPGGGTKDKPVGLVYVALSSNNNLVVKKYNFHSDRNKNKIKSSQAILKIIQDYCESYA